MENLPLTGTRIISFEQFGAAPYCTMLLADLGADVIKVEDGAGDYARRSGPQSLGEADSLYFQTFNLNKRSLCLNLKSADDRRLFEQIVPDCDAVVNNLRGSLPAKLGLDYAALGPLHPAIVCGHISAYGRTGSRAEWPGYDFLMQAEAGIMALTGEPDSVPSRVGLSMIDYMTGTMLATGLLAAISGAQRTGIGRDVDVSLFDTALHQLAYQGAWLLNDDLDTPRQPRSAHPSNAPVQLFHAADGWIYICCMNDKFWDILLEHIDNGDLAADARFSTMAGRGANREALTEKLDAIFGTRPVQAWIDLLKGQIPVAPVVSLRGALENPFVAEAEMVRELPHRSGRTLKMLANPIRLNGERLPQREGPALDADGDTIRAQYLSPGTI